MNLKSEIFCIIPARKGSNRLKNKNILPYKNKPLISHSIESAIKSKIFHQIFVSSDCKKVQKICKKFKEVTFIFRKPSLSNSHSTISDVCLDIFKEQKIKSTLKYFSVLYATSPLRNHFDIRKCYKKFRSKNADSIIAITKFYYPPYQALIKKRGLMKPMFKSFINLKSNKFENKIFVDSGSMYMAKVAKFRNKKTFYTSNLIGYYMDQKKSIDIDYYSDYLRLIKNN
jgi:CMP-N,N'-diacetyllegionaminic acid synthase